MKTDNIFDNSCLSLALSLTEVTYEIARQTDRQHGDVKVKERFHAGQNGGTAQKDDSKRTAHCLGRPFAFTAVWSSESVTVVLSFPNANPFIQFFMW